MANAGLVTLGPSTIQPIVVDWLDNSDGDTWLTFDNRLSVAVGAVPAYSEGSPDQGVLFVLPALTRSTIPLDPRKGVQLEVAAGNRFAGTQSSPLLFDSPFCKRSCPYLLHSAGGAPSCPLYPAESLVPATINVAMTGISQVNLWVGQSAPPTFLPSQQLALAPPDTCIVAATVVVQQPPTYVQVNDGLLYQLWMDLDAGNPTLQGATLVVPGDTAGTTATFDCAGAQALQLQNGVAGDFLALGVTAWLGVPPS